MPFKFQKNIQQIPDFDVLTEEPKTTAEIIKERLQDLKIKGVKIIRHDAVGEIISANYEIIVNEDTLCFIYEPLACHSYNIIKENGETIKIATIDTMLSFYLAFLYANRKYYHKERILCMSTYLFDVQQRNRLEQKGLLKRFSLNCIGHQETVEEMRAEKAAKYKELKNNKDHPEYEEYFLRYRPNDIPNKDKNKIKNNKIQFIPNTTNKSNKNTTNTQRQNKKKRINKTKKNKKHTKDPFHFLKFKDV
jgi:hypothetical protein